MKKNSGFTIVELLISIAIMGILAASMMFIFGDASAAAKAARVIADLRSLKAAGIIFLGEHGGKPGLDDAWNDSLLTDELAKYMDNRKLAQKIVTDMEKGSEYWIGLLGNYDEEVVENVKSQAGNDIVVIGEEDSPDPDDPDNFVPTPWIRVQ